MSAISVSEIAIADLKQVLRKAFPEVKSSHLTEAIAASMGFRTHAALIAMANETKSDPPIVSIHPELFEKRLFDLGYTETPGKLSLQFSIHHKKCRHAIQILDSRSSEIEYKSARSKAWRNLMVLAVNEGLRQKLFSLPPPPTTVGPGQPRTRTILGEMDTCSIFPCRMACQPEVMSATLDTESSASMLQSILKIVG